MMFSLDDASKVHCDVNELIVSRLLVTANSGAGKSRTLRRILEQTHGAVQQIVIDTEGEFGSLREKYDYVYAAPKGGDTIAHPRSAALLAIRLLELRVSAIVDLYELPMHDRIRFVKLYFDAMINAPKELWHPVMVVLDEAHVYCPEKGKGQAESSSAVVDMASRGRKRGFCPVYATQRIQKLSKDATADLNNKLTGRVTQSADVDRAAEEIGLAKAQRRVLVDLEPGQFLVSGPAFNVKGIVQVKVGRVHTTHPEAGKRIAFTAPPPTSKIRALLPKLSDLPAEAEAEKKTVDELKQEVARLKRELSAAPKPVEPKLVEVPVVDAETRRALETSVGLLGGYSREVMSVAKKIADALGHATTISSERIVKAAERIERAERFPTKGGSKERVTRERPRATSHRMHEAAASTIGGGERSVLTAIAQHSDGVDREQVSVLTGYKRSTRDAYLARLRIAGLIHDHGGAITVSLEGISALGSGFAPLPTGEALRDYWHNKLPDGERKLFALVVDAYPESADRDALGEESGYKRSTRDAYLSRLATRKLIIASRGSVRASDTLFND